MTIYKEYQEKTLTLAVEGRIDTMTAPELEKEVKESIEGAEELIFDFEKLEYISSAGLRLVLPERKYCTDNAAMIAVAGYYRYMAGELSSLDVSPVARIQDL